MTEPDTSGLTILMGDEGGVLETFDNPGVQEVVFRGDELTAVCPVTGQPDFYRFEIRCAGERCIESKSLKLYLRTFDKEGIFAEALATTIAVDVGAALGVGVAVVKLWQHVRGGIETEVTAAWQA